MTTWKFEKQAGQIIDQQDDPGAGWESSIEPYWPVDMDRPDIGIKKEASGCITSLSDGHTKVAKYPVSTPEDALASSMYFLAYGVDSIEKKAHKSIAQGLQNARVAYGVEIPDEFVGFVKEGGHQNAPDTPQEVYADGGEHLPVTTPQQCEKSIRAFEKHASRWSADDRMVIGRKLQHAAERHGIDEDVPHSSTEMSKLASNALDARIEVMKGLEQHPGQTDYLTQIAGLKQRLTQMSDYRSLLKAASDLESADIEAKVDQAWGKVFPDPVESIVGNHQADPLPPLDKEAGIDWSSVDWSGLREKFSDDVVDQIAANPEEVVPSLPDRERKIVEEYAKGTQ